MTEEMCIERFRNVSAMIRYHNDKMIEAFARFVRFSVLIVAGSFYVFLEGGEDHGLITVVTWAAPGLCGFVAVSSAAIILSNWFSWRGFRRTEAELLGEDSLRPKFWQSAKEQLIMGLIIFVACCLAAYFYWCVLPEKVL